MADEPDDRLAPGHRHYGGHRHTGRSAPHAQGPAARLRGACDLERRTAQHAFEVDGPRLTRGDGDLRQRARYRGAGHRGTDVGAPEPGSAVTTSDRRELVRE